MLQFIKLSFSFDALCMEIRFLLLQHCRKRAIMKNGAMALSVLFFFFLFLAPGGRIGRTSEWAR